MRRLQIHAEAANEAAEAAAWYEKERPGLGEDFFRRARSARLLLRRFPYAVVVRESAEEVLVIAFAHTARRPGYWRHRLKSGA